MIYFIRTVYILAVSIGYMPLLLFGWIRGVIRGNYVFFGRQLANYLETMGPAAVKIGQLLAARPDLCRDEIRAGLGRLQDKVRYRTAGDPMGRILRLLGPRANGEIAAIESVPIACGSIARVYRGSLMDGRCVALKVVDKKRTGSILADLDILLGLARIADRIGLYRSMPAFDSVREIRSLMADQADMLTEARYLQTIRKNLQGFSRILIPAPLEYLCTSEVLVMEFIDPFHKADSIQSPLSDRRKLALQEALTAVFKMIFEDGILHADLHPGNIGFSGERIVLLDFGIVADIGEATRRDFEQFFFSFVNCDIEGCADIVIHQSRSMPAKFDRKAFTAALNGLIRDYWGRPVQEFQVARFVADLFALQKKYGMVGSPEFVKVIFSLLAFEGVLKSLAPDLNFQWEANLFIRQLRRNRRPYFFG